MQAILPVSDFYGCEESFTLVCIHWHGRIIALIRVLKASLLLIGIPCGGLGLAQCHLLLSLIVFACNPMHVIVHALVFAYGAHALQITRRCLVLCIAHCAVSCLRRML